MPRMVTAASVAVAVRCVGTACTTAPSPTAVVLDLQEQQGVSVHPRSPRRAAEAGAAPARAVMLRTSDPVLARQKCPLGGPFGHSRSTCARSPPPMGAQSRPPRPVLGGRGGYSAQEPPSGVRDGSGTGAPCRSTSLPSAWISPLFPPPMPLRSGVEGFATPHWTLAQVAAAERRVSAHQTRLWTQATPGVAT